MKRRKVHFPSLLLLSAALLFFLLPILAILFFSIVKIQDGKLLATLEEYRALIQNEWLMRRFANSGIISLGTMIVQLPISLCLALFLSRGKGIIRVILIGLLILMLLMPFQTYMLPLFQLYKWLGLYDTHVGLILFVGLSSIGTLLLTIFIRSIPEEQWEAASMETSSVIQITWKIILPQILPALAILLLLSFSEAWNLVEPAIILLEHDELRPVSVSLNDFHAVSWAGAALYAMPVITLYMGVLLIVRGRKGDERTIDISHTVRHNHT